jgi:hypothetical protein
MLFVLVQRDDSGAIRRTFGPYTIADVELAQATLFKTKGIQTTIWELEQI